MHKASFIFPIFLFCLSLIFLTMFLASKGLLQFVSNSAEISLFPISTLLHQIHLPRSNSTELDKLRNENASLRTQLAKLNQLEQDNVALRDQFDTQAIPSKTLTPLSVVGMPNVIPHVSFPETIILQGGVRENVNKGSVIVVKDSVIGIVTNASDHYALAQLITSKQSSFSVKSSQSGAVGVAKGQGNGEIVMDNIVLSDTISVGDTIVTLGSQDILGIGYPPNLIVGKVISVEKNPSNLFQQARVIPMVQFNQLFTVFILNK